MAPVCLAVQAAGRNSRVEVDAVLGDRLQQMKQVQPDDAQCLVVALDLDAGPLPEARPGPDVPVEQLVEAPHPGDAACRCHGGLTDGAVPGSEDGNHLVDGDRLAAADVDGEIVADPAWLGCRAPADAQRPVLAVYPGSRCLGDPDVGLGGLHHQQQGLLVDRLRLEGTQVAAGQFPVPFNAGILHRAVKRRTHVNPARPVLGHDRRLQPAQVLVLHMHEPALGQAGGTARRVPEPDRPGQHAAAQVDLLDVVQEVDIVHPKPGAALDAECHRQPVGQVDDALVLDCLAVNGVAQPVVASGRIRARIVDVAGPRLGGGAPGSEVAVAQGAQRLAQAFLVRCEGPVAERPGSHQPRCE